MRSTRNLLIKLRELDIKLWLDHDTGSLRCNAPKGTLTPELQIELKERKPEIIAFLQEAQGAIIEQVETIPVVARDEQLNLSFAQQRMWFLTQLEGENAAYNIAVALHLKGKLHIKSLEQAFVEIIQRHEILRTTFTSFEGKPQQIIHSNVSFELEHLYLEGNHAQKWEKVQQLAQEAAHQTFDLAQGTLLRVQLLHLDASEQVLLVTMHHIISDGWSMNLFIEEFTAIYQAYINGQPSPLTALPIQYADFAHWQRNWLNGEKLAQQLNYWKNHLIDAPPLLELKGDYPRPPLQSFQGSTESFVINSELTEKLRTLSQKNGVTLFMTLLSAFAVLLARYSRQEDLVIGSPIANRNRKEIESLIGFFVNTLALRIKLEGNPSFLELLQRVRQVTLDSYVHQDLPFEKLVEELKIERNLSHNPLFQVMFVLQNIPSKSLEFPGLSLSQIETESNIAQFDLSLSLEESAEQLLGTWEYSKDLFESETIVRMNGHFQNLLEAIVTNPEQIITQLPLLSESEQQQLLFEWNDTASDYPQDKCIHQLFEEQVERTPDAIAVIASLTKGGRGDQFLTKGGWGDQLTYKQLNEKANQVAHYLQQLGVKEEVLVGLFVERSVQMIIGLLGILKAGGAYLPLDPSYPSERLSYMLTDSGTQILLTQNKLKTQLREFSGQIIDLEEDWHKIAQQSQDNPISNVQPSNLVYVIYTSGSTGQPKGVEILHQGLVNHSSTIAKAYQLNPSDQILQFASLSFDVAAEELFPTLITGASVILRPVELFSSSREFSQFIEQMGITVLNLPVAYWCTWIREGCELPRSVRLVIIGSEKVLPEDLVNWQKQVDSTVKLVNAYGPTEATITSSLYWVEEFFQETRTSVPIGKPIANTQFYLLDSHLQPLPIGLPGELYIGGVGLARGYRDRPELTQEKFISNPFNHLKLDPPQPPLERGVGGLSKLYKTGDLARYLKDGNLEFLGRIDNQVKIRGFRIELGEIEAILREHPFVSETVVIATEEKGKNQQLVAYVVVSQDLPTETLKSFLLEKLPQYMMPSVFIYLESLPLSGSGKLDRRALPIPDKVLGLGKEWVQPRNSSEEILAEIWTELLNLDRVSIHDNFFELGGHSLLATQVISRVRSSFLIELPLRSLFESPTIAELAEVIIAKQLEQIESSDLEAILAEVEQLSNEEIQKLLVE